MLVAVRRHDTLERHIHLADPGIRIQRAIGRFETHCPAKGHPEDIAFVYLDGHMQKGGVPKLLILRWDNGTGRFRHEILPPMR